MKLRHFWIFGMVCVLLSATAFSAQSTTATIQGLVSDEQKAAVLHSTPGSDSRHHPPAGQRSQFDLPFPAGQR